MAKLASTGGRRDVQQDGARVYGGNARVDSLFPRLHARRTMRVEVVSTRTRKHHFTIALGDRCVLAFHRPAGEKRHVYDLDAALSCPVSGVRMKFANGRLELDTANDTLALRLSGSVTADKKGTGSLAFELEAQRR
jgi:hypothetical protein